MTEQPRRLSALQQWMQTVITHPLGIAAGIAAEESQQLIRISPDEAEAVVTSSSSRSSIERLEVYGNAYFARLLECLREMHPALVHALSAETFDQFGLDYLIAYPPSSYTLNHLADNFVQYLKETRPPRESSGADWADFLIDLARMEWMIDDVFDGPGWERDAPLSAAALQAISPERWPQARLTPSPALRLLAFQFPINDYYTAFRRNEEPEMPSPEPTFLALNRRDYIVRRFPLSEPQHALLASLSAGEPVGEAIAKAAELTPDWDALTAQLRQWFFAWCADGFFRSVEYAG